MLLPANLHALFRDFGSLRGMDLFDDLHRIESGFDSQRPSFPPSDIIQESENSWTVKLALAGVKEEDVQVKIENKKLIIEGNISRKADGIPVEKPEGFEQEKEEKSGYPFFLKRGIAQRYFMLKFDLPDYTEATGATLEDGILSIGLVREIPETQKPKILKIENKTLALADKSK